MDSTMEKFVMRPGDTFVADECGCSFTVESGPHDESTVRQAPVCCCGHQMHKASFSTTAAAMDERSTHANAQDQGGFITSIAGDGRMSVPIMMRD